MEGETGVIIVVTVVSSNSNTKLLLPRLSSTSIQSCIPTGFYLEAGKKESAETHVSFHTLVIRIIKRGN